MKVRILAQHAYLSMILALPTSVGSAQSFAGVPKLSDPVLQLTVSEFHATWQIAWYISEESRRKYIGREMLRKRITYFQCRVDSARFDAARIHRGYYPPKEQRTIQGAKGGYVACPSWILTPTQHHIEDESKWRDAAIVPPLRPEIVVARNRLIASLDSALAATPGDPAIIGLQVRFRIDARDMEAAMATAQRCTEPLWWCSGLKGLVQARAGNVASAAKLFSDMQTAMPDSVKCQWYNSQRLLSEDEQRRYSSMSCEQKDSTNAKLWWLAHPLYRVPVNERLVEQDVRRMDIALRHASAADERRSFELVRGGDAIATMIERYGWPTYTGWGGTIEDRWFLPYPTGLHKAPPVFPYTTFEYTRDRVHTIPAWRAIDQPFTAASSDWELVDDHPIRAPVEHYRPRRPLVQLPDGQTVFIRRQDFTEVLNALTLAHPQTSDANHRFDVMMLATASANQIDSLDQTITAGGASTFLRGAIRNEPQILALEAIGDENAAVDARTRFAVKPPSPLSHIEKGQIALSSVALLSSRSQHELSAPHDSLLKHMLPTRRLGTDMRKVTLYWESYATLPEDSATIVIRVASNESLGLLRRMGMAAGVVSDPSSSVHIQWKDYGDRENVTTLRGPVPVQMRAVSLDLSTLRAGMYTVEIAIALQDGRSATQNTTIELTR